jgi:tetratricopeptide (TPR) repeat protein
MPEKQRSMRLLMIALLEMVAVLGTSGAQSTPDTQLRYKVDYQCNGERVQVGHCRKDDDGLGYGPPTKPQENYCMVYYPDRPKRGGFIVQSAELYDVVVKKLQACGALAGSAVAKSQSSNRTARDYRGEGEKYVDAKDYAHAVPLLQEAVRLNPNDALGQFLLGETYLNLGNKAGAAQIHKTLLTLDKEKADQLQ